MQVRREYLVCYPRELPKRMQHIATPNYAMQRAVATFTGRAESAGRDLALSARSNGHRAAADRNR